MKAYSIASRYISPNYARLIYNFTMQGGQHYRESKEYLRAPVQFPVGEKADGPLEYKLL